MPQDPLRTIRLFRTVLFRPPDRSMPVPIGEPAVRPKAGVLGLLLSCTSLRWMKVQELPGALGQAPSWGEGGSSLARELGRMPDRFRSHSESSIRSRPPALVPEYPSALFCACT